ncbi:MAG: leucine--tRNA ligase [Firmicutes bacterium]|nr:leucine--tRNA ligase [Bacillota bacterium]
MNHKQIEKKWQNKWLKLKNDKFDKKNLSQKYYVLEMFSYPSGANLHIGHTYNFAPSDTFARHKKMQGYNVFQPMGFDSFGLPAENYAIKTGIHPKDSINSNITKMQEQLKALGCMYDWDYEIVTSDPSYYKFTQEIFLHFYKKGLVYQKDAPVNFCTSCNTAIANEQVKDGACERCDSVVIKKNMRQWFFKITDYAEELLSGLDTIDWPEKTKAMQRNWIGKSIGCEIGFNIDIKSNKDQTIKIFTTRADTLFGVSYIVLAPEHPLVDIITTQDKIKQVKEYKGSTAKLSDIERQENKGDKTGVFVGSYCIHPFTNEKIPIYIADYCLYSYGTGAVMGVPAHDKRDYDFAKKYDLNIKKVIEGGELPFVDDGILINSNEFDGLGSDAARTKIAELLKKDGFGGQKINYRLRDWSISRQRYWGCPIPIVHCDKCGAVPLKNKDLPVELPYDVDLKQRANSPLSYHNNFINIECPKCGGAAKRDADTLDTFVCSSWYFLRYPDVNNKKKAFNSELINQMLPVDKYIGGAEHACMHLLYARFFTKAMRDIGLINFNEPFKSLVHQGLILGPDGEKMSKSKGNIVNPDKYIDEYGADVLRMYLCFAFSYIEGGPWNDEGIKSIAKFLDRVERLVDMVISASPSGDTLSSELEYTLNYTIKNANKDIENFSFNTAIARIMELVNAMYKFNDKLDTLRDTTFNLVKLLAPFAPHFCEELWKRLGHKTSIFNEKYPVCDESKLVLAQVEIAVQVNSKIISKIMIGTDWDNTKIEEAAKLDEKVTALLVGKQIKKVIVVKDRLINLIIG